LPDLAPEGASSPFAEAPAWAEFTPAGAVLPVFLAALEEDRALFRALSPGGPLPPTLAPSVRMALIAAGIASEPEVAAHHHEARDEALARAAGALRRARYAVLPDLVPPGLLPALQRYYRALVAEGWVPFGDAQVTARYAAHGEPLARALHARLSGLASALAGEPMKPSYPYFVTYIGGASLAPHRDRPQCELTISLLIDESPRSPGPSTWPLHLETPEGEVALHLHPGEGLAFYGRELLHSRPVLPEGRRSTSLLLHFVPEGFDGPLR
jgi:hypothetical protein